MNLQETKKRAMEYMHTPAFRGWGMLYISFLKGKGFYYTNHMDQYHVYVYKLNGELIALFDTDYNRRFHQVRNIRRQKNNKKRLEKLAKERKDDLEHS